MSAYVIKGSRRGDFAGRAAEIQIQRSLRRLAIETDGQPLPAKAGAPACGTGNRPGASH